MERSWSMRVFLLILMFLSACGHPETFAIDFSSYRRYENNGNLTDEQLHQALRDVVKFYNECGYPIYITEDKGNADSVIYWGPPSDDNPKALGTYNGYGQNIRMTPMTWVVGDDYECTKATYDLVTVLAHEVGHSQGLEHQNDWYDIMEKTPICYAKTYTVYCPNSLPPRINKHWESTSK
jgi:hypothetical protein